METKIALFAGVLPGAITLTVLALVWRAWKGSPTREPAWAAPVLVAVALVLGDYTKHGWPDVASGGIAALWPDSNTYRFPHAAVVLAVAGLIEAVTRLPVWGLTALRALAYGAVCWMLCEGYHPQVLATVELIGLIGVASVGMAGVAQAADRGCASLNGFRGPVLWAVIFIAAGPVALLGGLSYGMHVATAMIAFTVAAAIGGLLARSLTLARGGVTALVGVLLALILGLGVQTEPVSAGALIALAVSPAALVAAACVPASRRRAGVWFTGLCVVGVLSLAFGQLLTARAVIERDRADDPYADYYG